VRQAEQALRASQAAVEAARAERRPMVTLSTFYGRVNYPGGFVPEFDDFRTNWTVGVTAQIPLFTGGRLEAAEAIARAQADEAAARLQQVRELAALDALSAHEELEAAEAAWEASAGTVQQAVRAYEIAELRYRQGLSTQLELSDARLLLEQAQVNRAVAARDLQVARARVALLPDLPLGLTPAPLAVPAAPTPAPAPPPAQPQAPPVRTAAQTPGGGFQR
jgi:outer membrane protein TolC